MTVIGKDKICAVAAAADARTLWRLLASALRLTRTVELRLDWLAGDDEIDRFLRQLRSKKPHATLIATCRRRTAGGKYRGSIANQLLHLAEALRAGCAWYDLEIESIRECPHELLDVLVGEGRRLSSAHFFRRIPRGLSRIVHELDRPASNAIKIAAQCDSLADGLKLLRTTRRRKNVVAIPMGDIALPLRALVAKNGRAYIQAGAGIVADSVPEKEYAETVNKARAVITALEIAHGKEARG